MDGTAITEEAALVARARRVLPGGTFGNFAAEVILREGRGGRVWDVAGREYVDFLLGSGPMFLGHGHPEVLEAVREQLSRGTTFFANNEHGIALAEAIVDALPCAEQLRYTGSGTEADLYAMRLARAFTGRERILKFEGGYHGMSDYGLMSLAPKVLANFPRPVPDSPGIPRSVQEEVLVAPFNDLDAVTRLVEAHGAEIAAIIVEPLQRLIPPAPGFLAGLRALCDAHGIVLIFDEVVTGFRFAYGGAQSFYGVTPDLCTLGKIIGGGFPLAAVAGRADIMGLFDKALVGEERFLTQIGTLSGNPVAAVAGLKTLEVLRRPGMYERAFAMGRALIEGMQAAIARAGIAAQPVGEPVLFDIVFADGPIADYRATLRADRARAAHVNRVLRAGGIMKGDSKYYVSTAHEPRDVDQTLDAFEEALRSLPPG